MGYRFRFGNTKTIMNSVLSFTKFGSRLYLRNGFLSYTFMEIDITPYSITD